MNRTISLDHVVVSAATAHGEVEILSETTLELPESKVALVGPNGSGKSTLARLLNGLAEPASGTVTVHGLDVATQGREVRRTVGFVFTDPTSQLVMPTVLEDVALSLRRTHKAKAARNEAALAVLERFGLADLADRSVHTLSGGQRQLVALAGVLACDPSLVVADEPTTLLDLGNARMVADLLISLPQQLVVCTHDLELAARCDRALLVRGGKIVADGDATDVVAHYRSTA